MFDGRFRHSVDKGVSPLGAALRRTGLSPDNLTALGLAMAVPAAIAIGSGRLIIGLVLLIASAVPDLLDGALAKASGTASVRGAFFDSVADRVTDCLMLGGVGWYLQSRYHGHAALLAFAVLAASTVISYERAKAESLGFNAKGGLMERAERIIVICVGLAFTFLLVPLLWLMLTLTVATAIQRFVKVWRQASQPPAAPAATAAGVPGAAAGVPRAATGVPGAAAAAGVDPGATVVMAVPGAAGVPTTEVVPGAAGVPAGSVPVVPAGPVPVGPVPVAMAERWRAWREANGWGAPNAGRTRFAQGTRRGPTRGQERRAARRLEHLEHLDRIDRGDRGDRGEEGDGQATPSWRRNPGSRRP